jgi:hypothetical protein
LSTCRSDVGLERIECRDIQISCIAARVWQSHSRHADLRKVSKKRPSTQKYLAGHQARTPLGGLHSRRKILRRSSELTKVTTEL